MFNTTNHISINDIYRFNTNSIQFNLTYQYSVKSYNNTFNFFSFINDVGIYTPINNYKSNDFNSVIWLNDDNITTEVHANFPLFLEHKNKIKIPTKIEYALKRFTPKGLLRDIHQDIDVAIELCLLFASQLTSTYFESLNDSNSKGWKALKSEYLRDFISIAPLAYKNIRTALEYPLKKGSILQCDYIHENGRKSYNYSLGDAYIKKGIVTYELKTAVAKNLLNKRFLRFYKSATENIICKNLIEFYPRISLPTIDQIKKEAKRLIKLKYHTKKGKRLRFLNKHPRTYFKNSEELSFVEDAIEIYEYLTDNGLMVPCQGSERSGGRVVDSFTLMPNWIRRLLKVDGKNHIECDYSCLHPNIAIAIYGGSQEYLTHGLIERETGICNTTVKKEHLSFFNKTHWQMQQSVLWEYYSLHEAEMLKEIVNEKSKSPFKHRITSRRLFKKEVMIMTDVIKVLNAEEIFVGYIYDALFCHPKDSDRVKEVMDEMILKHGVKTTAKQSQSKRHDPMIERVAEAKLDLTRFTGSSVNKSIQSPIIYKDLSVNSTKLTVNASGINFIERIKQDVLMEINKGYEPKFIDALIDFEDGTYIEEKVLWVDGIINNKGQYITKSYLYE